MKTYIVLWGMILMLGLNHLQAQEHRFELGDSTFLLDGKNFQMISGEIHYPRVPREAWRQRMKMAKAMGLNTIGTYVFWNLHEPQKGVYDFSGNNDIATFVNIAKEEGLWVVLRPSPYVCAEWEFGGYPYWLQNEKGLVVRSNDPSYMNCYRNYIMQLGKQLAPLQVNQGGNILMIQVENEYGTYGSDKSYMEKNKELFVEAGFDGLLYTCDASRDVANGHLPGLLPAVNGIDKPKEVKQLVQQYHNGKGPYYIAEWYPAWFDWWGTKHHTVAPKVYADRLDSVLAAGISINLYMFHGGTTREFFNGSNYNDHSPFEPQISSYDYDAPLDEAGNPTEKFMLFRNAIQRNLGKSVTLPVVPAAKKSMTIPSIDLDETLQLYDMLPSPTSHELPMSFESLNQAYGYVLYRTTIPAHPKASLRVRGLRDYAVVMINGTNIGTLDRRLKQEDIILPASSRAQTLELLVENMGRINFGPYLLKNTKGLTDSVLLNQKLLKNWKMYSLPFAVPPVQKFKNSSNSNYASPVVRRGQFQLSEVADTYIDVSAWGKGIVFVNGYHLGRYWNVGPQQTIYLPAEWLKKGTNEIVIFEMLKPQMNRIHTLVKPILDHLN